MCTKKIDMHNNLLAFALHLLYKSVINPNKTRNKKITIPVKNRKNSNRSLVSSIFQLFKTGNLLTGTSFIFPFLSICLQICKAFACFCQPIIALFKNIVTNFKNIRTNFKNVVVFFKTASNDFVQKTVKKYPATSLPGITWRTLVKAGYYTAFEYSNVFNMCDKPLPGRKRSLAFLTSWEVTASEVSLPPELMLTRRLPTSPNWTMVPSWRSVIMFSSSAVSTAIQSAGRTVHWFEMRFDIFLKSVIPAVSAAA